MEVSLTKEQAYQIVWDNGSEYGSPDVGQVSELITFFYKEGEDLHVSYGCTLKVSMSEYNKFAFTYALVGDQYSLILCLRFSGIDTTNILH